MKKLMLFPFLIALVAVLPAQASAQKYGKVISVRTVSIDSPGNKSVSIVPFTDAIYPSCAGVPEPDPAPFGPCMAVGGVKNRYQIGELEVTVAQYVAFLNTANYGLTNPPRLYTTQESATRWPRFGSINFDQRAPRGTRYSVAYPQWANKPYGFATFGRAARFVNALQNGTLLSKKTSRANGRTITTYRVQLSARTETGMYDLGVTRPSGGSGRKASKGFVIPSQNEWMKAAYYDPKGGGTDSYWKYPTNAGVFGDGAATAPNASLLNPGTGAVTNASSQPLSTYTAPGLPSPQWCPSQVSAADCSVYPFPGDPTELNKFFQGSVSTVGQTRTRSPWGTLDQGGNVVEWTDTIAAAPVGEDKALTWRRLHGGIASSPVGENDAIQLWLSAVGLDAEDNNLKNRYPWFGFRIGVIGSLTPTPGGVTG
ncbi:unannotated protein [freshwater metagenome]|uniref:Unannotated protein n=1 Tax=freshwater metagenome TaxID=449393 RepID=A0A6J5ZB73_9ZZZZ